MPKFRGCIEDAVKVATGAQAKAVLRQALKTYDEAFSAASEAFGPGEADRTAAEAVVSAIAAQDLRAKQLRAMAIRARREVLGGVAELKRRRGYGDVQDLGSGGKPPKDGWVQGGSPRQDGPKAVAARALELLVEGKPGLAGAPFPSIEGRYRAIRGELDAMMADVIERFESKTGLGEPDRATLDLVVREAFGEATGNPAAKGLAEGWAAAAEHVRQLFNAAGGGIGKIDGWGLPQHHDPLEVRRAGKAAWVEAIVPRLDRGKMIDRVTGLPFSEKRLRAVLSETYDSIATGGLAGRKPGEHLGEGALANRRAESRFLAFKSAEDWLAYQDQFGAGDPFGIMMGHLDEMARDVAQMQILGPNPDHQFDWLARFAQREAALEEAAGVRGAIDKAKVHVRTATDMLDHFTGAASVPEREWVAKIGATTRAILTPAALGSALLSDVPSSPVFGAYARSLAGLNRLGHMDQLVALLASPEARANARRSGFVIEQATDALVRGAQDGLRLQTVGSKIDGRGFNVIARRLPAGIFRLSGLTGWTAARKRAFRLEFMGALADRRGQTLAELAAGDGEDRAFAELLAAHGFSEADWAKAGAAATWSPDGHSHFLRPPEVVAVDQALGYRLAELIELQTRQAVPETSLWTRAKLLGQSRPGTFFGEFRRSWAMFRSFTMTATQLYAEDLFLRGVKSPGDAAGAAAAAAGLLTALTIAGAVSIQLRELAKFNDPRPMDSTRFWAAAAAQGGGFGILGDFLYSTQSRAGKSAATTGWGPAAAFGTDLLDASVGNVEEIAGDMDKGDTFEEAARKAHPGRDAVTLMRRYVPWASLWWLRGAWDHVVADKVQRLVDPDAQDAFERKARRLQKEYGQGQWWRNGEALPARLPEYHSSEP